MPFVGKHEISFKAIDESSAAFSEWNWVKVHIWNQVKYLLRQIRHYNLWAQAFIDEYAEEFLGIVEENMIFLKVAVFCLLIIVEEFFSA